MRAFAKNNSQNSSPNTAVQKKGEDSFFGVQAKLAIGKANDKYETEADAVADKVVKKTQNKNTLFGGESFFPSKATPIQKSPFEEVQQKEETEEIQEKPLVETITPVVQLTSEDEEIQEKCAECEAKEEQQIQKLPFEDVQQKEDEERVQEKCAECDTEEKGVEQKVQKLPFEDVQQKTESSKKINPLNFERHLNNSKGNGSQLSSSTKTEMESGFGSDFSNVRIHTDEKSIQMNEEIGAQAFTNGSDIYFNEGKFQPESTSGKHLLAHELTHTVQQGASLPNVQKKKEPSIQLESEEEATIEEVNTTNPNAPSSDPYFEPIDRDQEKSKSTFEQENKSGIKDQVEKETNQAASESPVKAKIEEGKPTVLEPESEESESDKKIEPTVESSQEVEMPTQNGGQSNTDVDTPKSGKKENKEEKTKAKNNEEKPQENLISTQPIEAPQIGEDPGVSEIQKKGTEEPSKAELEEFNSDTRSEEEKVAEQMQLATQFNQEHQNARVSIEQKIAQEISRIRMQEQLISDTIRQQSISMAVEVQATIAAQKAALQAGYLQTQQTLEVNKEADFAKLESTKASKLVLLSTEMETRRTSFNAYVDEQTNLPTVNATNEANRADSELEAAAVEAIAEGESVAGQHPGGDDGNPEAREAVREIASETAADIRNSKATIREDLLNLASEFNGGFEDYRTDILGQIDSTEEQLTTAINDSVERFKGVITESYTKVLQSLSEKEQEELTKLDELQAAQLEALSESEQTGLNTVAEIANNSVQEIETSGRTILEMIDSLGENTTSLLQPDGSLPILSAMRDLQQNSIAQLHSIEQDGIHQIDSISNQGFEAIQNTFTANTEAGSAIITLTSQQSTSLVESSATQRETSLASLRTTLDTSFGSMEGALDEMRTEGLAGLDEAIEERKGNMQQANDEFLTELVTQNDENIQTAKQPLTDPLVGRLWSAADRATASWWEGLLAAIADFIIMLIILVIIAAILVALGVFSTITGALLVIGAVLLAVIFIVSLVDRLMDGNGWMSIPLAFADTLGITLIYEAIAQKDIATGEEKKMNAFDRWYSGTTGVLQFISIILPFKNRIPIVRNIRFPRIFGEGSQKGLPGLIARGIRWVEGIGESTRTRRNGGVEPTEEPFLEQIANKIAKWLNPEEPSPETELSGRRPNTPERPLLDENGQLTEYGRWYYEKPGNFRNRSDIEQKVWDQSLDSDGVARGPNGEELSTTNWKMEPRPGQDLPQLQQRAAENNFSRKQFLDEYNNPDNYRATVRDPAKQFSGPRPSSPEQPLIDPQTGELTAYAKWYYERPGFRGNIKDVVWENAEANSIDGKVYDRVTGQEMIRTEPWEMGHRYGFEFRKHQASAARRGIDVEQFRVEHNNAGHYEPELPSSNAGHQGEAPDGIYYGP